MINETAGYSFDWSLEVDGRVVLGARCGDFNTFGCANDSYEEGVVYSVEIVLENESYAPEDTVAPVISLTGDATVSVSQNEPYIDLGASADTGETVVVDSSAVDTAKVGRYTVTYNVSDEACNSATNVTRIVNVVGSLNRPPVFQKGGNEGLYAIP